MIRNLKRYTIFIMMLALGSICARAGIEAQTGDDIKLPGELRIMRYSESGGALMISGNDEKITESYKGSAYQDYEFVAGYETSGICANADWTIEYTADDGSRKTKHVTESQLVLPEITDTSEYMITGDGCIEFTLTALDPNEGKQSEPFKVSMDLKPSIENVDIIKIVDNAPLDSYDAHYEVQYKGAKRVTVSVGQEYSSKVHTSIIGKGGKAAGVADNLYNRGMAWIEFVVRNDFGKAQYILDICPDDTTIDETSVVSPYLVQCGDTIRPGHVFSTDDPITFTLKEEMQKPGGKWTYEYKTPDGDYEICADDVLAVTENGCTIYPEKIPFRNLQKDTYAVNGDRRCYNTYIAYNDGENYYYRYILFGAPSKKIEINNIKLTCAGWVPEYDDLDEASLLEMDVTCPGATEVWAYEYAEPDKHYFSLEEFLQDENKGLPFELRFEGKDKIHVPITMATWGAVYEVGARNRFGYTKSDTLLFSTDYITDPEVLARIEELRNKATGVGSVAEDSGDVLKSSDGEAVVFTREMDSAAVYDLSGVCLIAEQGCSRLDTSHLPNGVYIVDVTWTDSTGTTKRRNIKLLK